MRLRTSTRSGYTLLEVLLASAIAVLMLAALYTAIDVQLAEMDAGRERVESSALARALFNRISHDLAPSLAPTSPPVDSGSAAGGGGGAGGGGAAAATPPSGSPMAPGSGIAAIPVPTATAAPATTTTADPTATSTSTTPALNFGIGVKGESDRFSIFLTRLSRSVISPPDDGAGNAAVLSDVLRISYFIAADGGLVRQEIRLPTSEQVDSEPIDGDEAAQVLAPEVSEFEVRYYDGTSWQSSWDGSTPGADGKTPRGPPRAIEVTVTMQEARGTKTSKYRHVIAFPAAPGTPTTTEETTPPGN